MFKDLLLRKKKVNISGRFELIRKLGSGSFGDIYLAFHSESAEVNLKKDCRHQFCFIKM